MPRSVNRRGVDIELECYELAKAMAELLGVSTGWLVSHLVSEALTGGRGPAHDFVRSELARQQAARAEAVAKPSAQASAVRPAVARGKQYRKR